MSVLRLLGSALVLDLRCFKVHLRWYGCKIHQQMKKIGEKTMSLKKL